MNTYKNLTESGVVTSKGGKLVGVILNSHSSGTLALVDGTTPGVVATSTFTSTGSAVKASHGQTQLTSAGALVEATHVESVMTGNAIVAGNIVVIGSVTYTFVAAGSSLDDAYDVAVSSTLTLTLVNLLNAINADVDSGGFNASTPINTQVRATASDATTVTVRGIVPGTSLNAVASTGTTSRTVWADTTLGGGTGASVAGVATTNALIVLGAITYTVVDALSETYGADAVAYQVLAGAAEKNTLDNLKAAVNGTGTAGTEYSTGTLAHTYIIATTNTDTVQTFVSRTVGVTAVTAALNALATTTTCANTSWADTTFGGGTGESNPVVATNAAIFTINGRVYTSVIELSETSGAAAVADQILWVTSEAVYLDNMKSAINGSGTVGTDYSTGTTPNADVVATTNAADSQIINARVAGTGGNALTTTDAMANYAWTSTVMASGTGGTGTVICSTITLSSVATTGERFIPFYDLEFTRGLYLTVGGTADVTFVIN